MAWLVDGPVSGQRAGQDLCHSPPRDALGTLPPPPAQVVPPRLTAGRISVSCPLLPTERGRSIPRTYWDQEETSLSAPVSLLCLYWQNWHHIYITFYITNVFSQITICLVTFHRAQLVFYNKSLKTVSSYWLSFSLKSITCKLPVVVKSASSAPRWTLYTPRFSQNF